MSNETRNRLVEGQPDESDAENVVSRTPKRRKGNAPTSASIQRIAASLKVRTRQAVQLALRTGGCSTRDCDIGAVLEAASAGDFRRERRSSIRIAERLGHEPKWVRTAPSRSAAALPSGTLQQRLDTLRRAAVRACAANEFRHGAAGGHSMTVRFAVTAAEVAYAVRIGRNWDTYRGAYKGWGANEDHHVLCVPKDWRVRIERRGLAVLGGMMTLDAHALESAGAVQVFSATWARQGRGFDVLVDQGFIAVLGTEHFHGASAEKAIAGVRRKCRAVGLTAPYTETIEAFVSRYSGVDAVVSVMDAKASGACDYGIRSWCAGVGLDYELGEVGLARVLDGFRARPQAEVRRAVVHAVRRYRAGLRPGNDAR